MQDIFFLNRFAFGRHGIVTLATPWMTAQDAAQSQPAAAQGTMTPDRLNGVGGTGGLVTAVAIAIVKKTQQRAKRPLVKPNQANKEPLHSKKERDCKLRQPGEATKGWRTLFIPGLAPLLALFGQVIQQSRVPGQLL
jgi:hypothetical protein